MKSPLIILLAFLGIAINCTAQVFYQLEPIAQTEYFKFGDWTKEAKTAVIFADVCNVRSAADAKSEVAGKLSIGTPVQIIDVSATTFTQAGITSPWVKIKSGSLTGYVWGGLLTNASVKTSDGRMLVWGLAEIKKVDEYNMNTVASVRLVANGAVIDKHDFPVKYASRPDDGFINVYAPPQLTGVKHLIVFGTPSEACGVTASQHYILYTESKLVFVGSGYSMGDAGVLSTSLEYIFPFPKKEEEFYDYHYTPDPEHIKRVENEGSYDDNCDWIETYKSRDFKWENGLFTKFCEQ